MLSSSVEGNKHSFVYNVFLHAAIFLNLLKGLFSSLKPTVHSLSSPVYSSYRDIEYTTI